MSGVSISVVGSVNLDIVARAERLPAPGETVTGATLAKYPGGKGANIALAAQRLGAKASLIARVGDDPEAEAALRLLKAGGVDLSACEALADVGTGVALIAVSEGGENQIIVASGANDRLLAEAIPPLDSDATLCVLEVPVDAVLKAGEQTRGFFAVNLAPALPVPDALIARADLLIVNEGEAAVYGDQLATARQVAVTHGARGAVLMAEGEVIAEAPPPPVTPVDTTGAGDTFSAALTLALCEGQSPQAALKFAVTAGALTTTRAGAQPSFPMRGDVDRLLQA
ncbi:MAG: ribokinase [Pseudomonadota bacterium]